MVEQIDEVIQQFQDLADEKSRVLNANGYPKNTPILFELSEIMGILNQWTKLK